VPERRPQRSFPQPPADQPSAEWAPERAPEVTHRAVEPRAAEHVAPPIVDTPAPAAVVDAPVAAAAPRGRRKAPAAPAASGERFQEHNQPSFLAAPRRRTKAEKAVSSDDAPSDEGKGD
jgi:hypothetical protein